jgi:hypothetical protein
MKFILILLQFKYFKLYIKIKIFNKQIIKTNE